MLENEKLRATLKTESYYMTSIAIVAKENQHLAKQLNTQRDAHKKSTAQLRHNYRLVNGTLRQIEAKYHKMARHFVKLGANECAVCLEEFDSEREAYMMNCIHIICHRCALTWLDKSKTNAASCPICRVDYRQEHLTALHFGRRAEDNTDLD